MRSGSRENVQVQFYENDNNDDDYDRKQTHIDQRSSLEPSALARKTDNSFSKITIIIMEDI